MKVPRNPAASRSRIRALRMEDLGADLWRHRDRPAAELAGTRELTRLLRKETAAAWIGRLRPGMHLWGFSKGQFSLIQLYQAILDQLACRYMAISTWTIGRADKTQLEQLAEIQNALNGETIQRFRILLDLSFQRREPALIQHIRETFGDDAIRITRNHAKFGLMDGTLASGERLRLVIRTSMNLNANPRLEDVELADDPELFAFLDGILDDIWNAHDPRAQARKKVKELAREFTDWSETPTPDHDGPPADAERAGRRGDRGRRRRRGPARS